MIQQEGASCFLEPGPLKKRYLGGKREKSEIFFKAFLWQRQVYWEQEDLTQIKVLRGCRAWERIFRRRLNLQTAKLRHLGCLMEREVGPDDVREQLISAVGGARRRCQANCFISHWKITQSELCWYPPPSFCCCNTFGETFASSLGAYLSWQQRKIYKEKREAPSRQGERTC